MTRASRLAALVAVTALAGTVIVFSGTAQAAPLPEGFLGVPWGATPEAVETAMAERHYPKDPDSKPDCYIYNGYFAGERAYVSFHFVDRRFVEGVANLIELFRDAREGDFRGRIDLEFSKFEGLLTQKYGKPTSRYLGTNEPWMPRSATWNLQDQGSAITVVLVKNYSFKDKDFDINSKVAITYKNVGLKTQEQQRAQDQDL
jgi:hypothetical protein